MAAKPCRRFKRLALLVALRHADAGTTSDYARPSRARDLRAHEVGCSLHEHGAHNTGRRPLPRLRLRLAGARISFASPTSAILSYVTPDAVPSELRYKRQDQRLWRTAFGDRGRTRRLANVDPMLWAPTMGEPSYTLDEVRAAANTTSWAVPGSASRRAPPFPRWLQSYNDPAMIYSSPVIHTVTLTDLAPGETYEYELADGVHAFRMPPRRTPSDWASRPTWARRSRPVWNSNLRRGVGFSPLEPVHPAVALVDFHTGRVEIKLAGAGRRDCWRPVLRGRLLDGAGTRASTGRYTS